ncbi:hypothetical protein EGW08_018173 [Elysia chlorotica]|uniref:Uncharacterized protein n=1 Tax=Elysia chlorotica TaxID=188477 RepID=A0A3S0Z9X7_ELYCH|nr:hypothetical protein EGW08_018173 [Elysia chlorotica]
MQAIQDHTMASEGSNEPKPDSVANAGAVAFRKSKRKVEYIWEDINVKEPEKVPKGPLTVKRFQDFIYLNRVQIPPYPRSSALNCPVEEQKPPAYLMDEKLRRLRIQQDQECLNAFWNWGARMPTMEACSQGVLTTVRVEVKEHRYQDIHILRPTLKLPGQPDQPRRTLNFVSRLRNAFSSKKQCDIFTVPVPPQAPRTCKRGA